MYLWKALRSGRSTSLQLFSSWINSSGLYFPSNRSLTNFDISFPRSVSLYLSLFCWESRPYKLSSLIFSAASNHICICLICPPLWCVLRVQAKRSVFLCTDGFLSHCVSSGYYSHNVVFVAKQNKSEHQNWRFIGLCGDDRGSLNSSNIAVNDGLAKRLSELFGDIALQERKSNQMIKKRRFG